MAITVDIILFFFIYSFIGWLWETIYCSLKAKKFVYRGFLTGPYCPIYGFGILSVLYFLDPFRNNVLFLYFLSAILVTVIEYFTSFILEKLFHATWWNYSAVPLNINGRVAIPVSLFWGVGCVLIVKVIHPKVILLERFLAYHFGFGLPAVLLILFSIDIIYTIINMKAFQKAAGEWSQAILEKKKELSIQRTVLKEEVKQRTESLFHEAGSKREKLEIKGLEWLEAFKEERRNGGKMPHLNFTERRFMRNYSHLQLKDIDSMEDLRELYKSIYEKVSRNKNK